MTELRHQYGKEGVKFWTEQLQNSPFQMVGDNGELRVEMGRCTNCWNGPFYGGE